MKTPFELFLSPYSAWLSYTRSMFTGARSADPALQPTPREVQVAAQQEWEDEGGSVKGVSAKAVSAKAVGVKAVGVKAVGVKAERKPAKKAARKAKTRHRR